MAPITIEPRWYERLPRALRLDLAPQRRPPANSLVVAATAVAVVVSLVVDDVAVHLGTSLFPTTRHFSHFRFSDYATLTIIGVLLACPAWPAVARLTSAPRWLFFRLATGATIVLWLPDGWLLLRGENAKAVAVLMVMHLCIALVTYNLLVHVARVGPVARIGHVARVGPPGPPGPPVSAAREPRDPLRTRAVAEPGPDGALQLSTRVVRRVWSSVAVLVVLEVAFGVATIVSVPFRRPGTILPTRHAWVYVAHGTIGIALGVAALAVLVLSTVAGRMARIGAVMGAAGVVVGLIGGVFASFQETRLLGMGVMLVGAVVAGVGYLVPSLDALGKAEAARATADRATLARAQARRAEAAAIPPAGDEPVLNGHGAEPPRA